MDLLMYAQLVQVAEIAMPAKTVNIVSIAPKMVALAVFVNSNMG
jgi:hypothetical protein